MMTVRLKFAVSLVAALASSAPVASAAVPAILSGSLAGVVRDPVGVPQMGASVSLFNRYERLIQRTLTNERGLFGFEALPPDLYSVRIRLASFVPAMKQKIAVQPGMQSLLYVDLTSVLSSIELVYAAPGQGALMSDDWKWTLKASASTRPVLRFLPDNPSAPTEEKPAGDSVFSDTYGVLRVSAGDPGSLVGTSSQADLGTAFALATSLFGRNRLQLSGNVGYSGGAGLPASGFRTSFSRDGFGPEVAITMQQVYLPGRSSLSSITGQPEGAPAIRSLSVAMHDSLKLSENLRLDYGTSLDSITFLDHLNYLSEFARLSYNLGDNGTIQLAYSSGAPPTQFLAGDRADNGGDTSLNDAALAGDLAALSILPQLSLLEGHAAIQHSQDFELGYEKKLKDTTLDVTGYRESVTNLAMTVSAPGELFSPSDLLPDISSNSSVLDAGSFQRFGYAASATQALGEKIELGTSFGREGALTAASDDLAVATAEELRSNLHPTQRFWASARASVTLPVTGTIINASYQWMDYRAIMPSHFYLTQRAYPEPGLNIRVRQPIPSFLGMPGRLEASAELRNMMAQGYIRISDAGQNVLLIQNPRAVRGGLSFIF
jgi:Carboxypeptidase regulatory-like domain